MTVRSPSVRAAPHSGTATAAPDLSDTRTAGPGDTGPGCELCGREHELAVLDGLLKAADGGTARLVAVDGQAGMGKTALVREFLRRHPVPAYRVCGEETESALPYGAFVRLMDRLTAALPGGGPGVPPQDLADPFVAGSCLLDVLGRLEDGALRVIVFDDAQWADAPSLESVAFALRRLRADRILTVVVVRDSAHPGLPESTRRLLADDETERLTLGPLDVADFARLGARLLPAPLPPRAVTRLHDHTGGNPLHARALLREVPADVLAGPEASLPAPRSYSLIVLARLARCDRAAQDLVAAASVLGMHCDLRQAARLAGIADPLPAVEQSIAQELLEERLAPGTHRVSFPHPLVRASVYHHLGPMLRTELHSRAAEATADRFGALWHRLRAADGTDPDLAAELAAVADEEAAAGRWSSAATLARHASGMAAAGPERDRLAVAAADALLSEGRADEAAALIGALSAPAESARHRYAEGHLAFVRGNTTDAWTLLTDAWEHCDKAADPALARRVAERLAMLCLAHCRGAEAACWAERATALTTAHVAGGTLRYCHLVALGMTGAAERGVALTGNLPAPALVGPEDADLLLGRGMLRVWSDDLEGGRDDLRAAVRMTRHGPVPLRVLADTHLGQAEFRIGRWDEAVLHLGAGCSIATDAGQSWLAPHGHAELALVLALRDDREGAAAHLAEARCALGATPDIPTLMAIARSRACLAVARGDQQEVVRVLRPLLDLRTPEEPAFLPWHDLLAHAQLAVGAYEECAGTLALLDELALATGRRSALAAAARERGCLLAARHRPDAAERAFRTGWEHATAVANPFDRARLALDFGIFLRRTGRRAAATESLLAAHRAFGALGAVWFADRCVGELAACGQPVGPVPAVLPLLTPQELAVARLAAEGLTNRRIALDLVLSVKTVEYHLSHTYAKLGIGSRTELPAKLAPKA
ncbi:AAA family ATPase [Streptomyces sp. HC44]|uniref:AAA family ATPase n=1 Tax=Streptomyces scabichelini TaxID=2711217 RepID=A0A6G4VJ90_9ACTN|nr:AAA family ATPase [Streptomyces scabichelini]NGO14228.1 AAA family ATPase [Streptomyces scabichelini]